jgi:hypothetical protein
VTELLKYLEKKNEGRTEDKMTIFHCVITALARMLYERPLMNRFIQGYRIYERNEISLSFVAKRRFGDGSEESLMYMITSPEDTVDVISKKIIGDVKEMRKSEHSTGGIDALLDACLRYYEKTGRRISFEYAMINGVNDSDHHAKLLADCAKKVGAHVNLITLNYVAERPFKPTTDAQMESFIKILTDRGVNVTVRRKLGSDVDASCGQLRRKRMTT